MEESRKEWTSARVAGLLKTKWVYLDEELRETLNVGKEMAEEKKELEMAPGVARETGSHYLVGLSSGGTESRECFRAGEERDEEWEPRRPTADKSVFLLPQIAAKTSAFLLGWS